jgi:hypothetical protein
VQNLRMLSKNMFRIRSLLVKISGGMKSWTMLNAQAIPTLHELHLRGTPVHSSIGRERPMTLSCPSLTTMTISEVSTIGSFPDLPALQNLSLSSTKIAPRTIHDLFIRAPHLRQIILVRALDRQVPRDPSFEQVTHPVNLPNLETLEILQDTLQNTWGLLRMLPNPSATFRIAIRGSDERRAWSSKDELNGFIMSRLTTFWDTATHGSIEFPFGKVIVGMRSWTHRVSTEVVFHATASSSATPQSPKQPLLLYRSTCFISEADPLLHRVRSVRLACRRGCSVKHALAEGQGTLECLPFVHALHVTRAQYHSDAGLRSLESWLVSRREAGQALRIIKFSDCDQGYRPFVERLVDSELVDLAEWENDYAPWLTSRDAGHTASVSSTESEIETQEESEWENEDDDGDDDVDDDVDVDN